MTEKTETLQTSEENLQTYEELFAHRYTSEDRDFQQYVDRPPDPPPIVEDWRSRGGGNHRGRDNRYQDRRGGRGWGGDRGWRGDQRGQQHWQDRDRHDRDRDRHDRDRHWGHGSGSGSHHGYNSQQQRPHYDRY